jgi:RNA recognition motif-containing protein
MPYTVFLGNLPTWVTADDIKAWLVAEALVADSVKVIRNPETQESKGFAFIEAPNAEEMQSIIKRFDRAPLEDKLLRANPAQPPRGKGAPVAPRPAAGPTSAPAPTPNPAVANRNRRENPARRPTSNGAPANGGSSRRPRENASPSAFAEELAKAL